MDDSGGAEHAFAAAEAAGSPNQSESITMQSHLIGFGESHSGPSLPRRSVVLITGNNRTKKALIGQQAVVRRAVGLGGWHHVVLQDGTEIKLQRNALQVVELGPPEMDDLTQGSSSDTDEPRIEILTQPRIRRPPKTLMPSPDMPLFKRCEASNSSGMRSSTYSLVDLHKLETTSLKRYRRAFQLVGVDAAAPKADLVTAVQQHFTTQEVDEEEVLCELVCALRRRHKRQQLLPPYSSSGGRYVDAADPYSCGVDHQQQQQQQQDVFCQQQQQQQQLTQMILMQQQYVYMGPRLFQDQPAPSQQQPQPQQQQQEAQPTEQLQQ